MEIPCCCLVNYSVISFSFIFSFYLINECNIYRKQPPSAIYKGTQTLHVISCTFESVLWFKWIYLFSISCNGRWKLLCNKYSKRCSKSWCANLSRFLSVAIIDKEWPEEIQCTKLKFGGNYFFICVQ